MTRNKFIGANWKMNPPPASALMSGSPYHNTDPTVIVFPMMTDISACIDAGLIVGGQYGHPKDSGAFTGDIPMIGLKSLGCTHVLCGHSERRQYHKETDKMMCDQVESALRNELIPLLCIVETEEERNSGRTHDILKNQLSLVLTAHSSKLTSQNFLIAYEPVWAIGTGVTPTPTEAQNTHAFIRSQLHSKEIKIIYGGSVNASNAKAFFCEPDIDGGLIGGASLKPDEFQKIVEAAKNSVPTS